MQRVVIWADEWYPVIGGLELALHRTALSLTESGISVLAVIPRDRLKREKYGYEIAEISGSPWMPIAAEYIRRQVGPSDVVYVARLFRKTEPAQLALMRSMLAIRLLRIPSTWGKRRYNTRQFKKLIENAVDAFVVLNSKSQDELRERFPNKEAHLCFNWAPRATTPLASQRSGFVYAGRLAKSKNLPALLSAWGPASQRTGDILTLLTDATQYPEKLEELYNDHRATPIRVAEPYIPGDLTELAKYCFVILPSFREGCPNVLVEAYSQGTPVIGSAVPGVAEHIKAVGSPVIDHPTDMRAILRAINEAQSLSSAQYRNLQRRVLDYHALNFSTERVASLIRSYLTSRQAHPSP